jgi:hypothetical protein
LVFRVERDALGQLVARSAEPELTVYGATREELVEAIHEAVRRHYGRPAEAPGVIRLHWVEEQG